MQSSMRLKPMAIPSSAIGTHALLALTQCGDNGARMCDKREEAGRVLQHSIRRLYHSHGCVARASPQQQRRILLRGSGVADS